MRALTTAAKSRERIETVTVQRKVGGSLSELARDIGVSRATLNQWKKRGEVPVRYCVQIEQLSNGAISRKDLRPKDWQLYWPELAKGQ